MTENNGKKIILERMPAYSSRLYLTHIRPFEINMIRLDNKELFTLWHDRLEHPSTRMILKLIDYLVGHPFRNIKISLSNELLCTFCSLEKFITTPLVNKIATETPSPCY